MPDYWESIYFQNATDATPDADADGDGADNLSEYIAGTVPTNSSSVFEANVSALTGSTVLSWNPVEGRVYTVLWTDNLLYTPFTNNISVDLPYPINSYTDLVEHAGAQIFYRIDVRLQE